MYKVRAIDGKLEASKLLERMPITVMEGPGGVAAERISGINFAVGLMKTQLIQGGKCPGLLSVWTLKWMKYVRMLERDLGVFYYIYN